MRGERGKVSLGFPLDRRGTVRSRSRQTGAELSVFLISGGGHEHGKASLSRGSADCLFSWRRGGVTR
ncbi:hypothetical protein AGR4C_Cc160257 [Agrobacterium tumefaciens str. Kerr 14]|uniref:Uncharacterized protein n=2 Tax=Agrobacterium TaxID=357 RepID=A0A1S7R7B6_9HYPH|nr:hypothetical protein AGR4C_Cc160257 [Agrobacterium tumefaciens str. Kerr 14]CUX47834.1 hypothetical protein AGR7C_Lc130010 [Agrobacterium deltaense Zutra 3/1]